MTARPNTTRSTHAASSRTDGRAAGWRLPAQVVHHIAGRLRVRFEGVADPDFYARLEQALGGVPGVQSVRVNAAARSAVVRYEPQQRIAWDDLRQSPGLQELLVQSEDARLAAAAESAARLLFLDVKGYSQLAESLIATAEALDRRVRMASDGYLDLKVLLPLATAAFSTLQDSRSKGTPRWMTLCTFAFNAFVSLHRNRIGRPGRSVAGTSTLH